jgi:hypothetical protein
VLCATWPIYCAGTGNTTLRVTQLRCLPTSRPKTQVPPCIVMADADACMWLAAQPNPPSYQRPDFQRWRRCAWCGVLTHSISATLASGFPHVGRTAFNIPPEISAGFASIWHSILSVPNELLNAVTSIPEVGALPASLLYSINRHNRCARRNMYPHAGMSIKCWPARFVHGLSFDTSACKISHPPYQACHELCRCSGQN